jgi:ABC-2 type transport system ATP-binding protein
MSVIEVTEVTKVYGTKMRRQSVVALNNASLQIQPREIFGLLGPNGAGKTTLFKLLLGITSITSGDVLISGLPPSNPRSRQKVGYLPENHRFPSHLTGGSLLRLTGQLYGLTVSEMEERADRLLGLVGMDQWADYKITKYSKGMSQRIGLAQAMISDPDILLLDEPTDGVDPVGKMEIRKVLQRVRDEGKTIVLNSHLLSEVESFADRVAILQKGKVIKVDSVDNLTSQQKQTEIEANIGAHLLEVPPEIGKVVAITPNRLIVELVETDGVNWIIDRMRAKSIAIKSIKPLKVSLEQSFMEAVAGGEEAAQ